MDVIGSGIVAVVVIVAVPVVVVDSVESSMSTTTTTSLFANYRILLHSCLIVLAQSDTTMNTMSTVTTTATIAVSTSTGRFGLV